jgi:2,5-diamino-6-(ribosylamino)-4(3H)-pyrimidinone 5'-phosphate reductase
MVASADGRAAVGGKASGIGGAVDRIVMRNLRAQVDAVMVGAGTLRAERLSLGLDETARGPQPLAVVLTASGDLPVRANLVPQESQDVLVICTEAIAGTLGTFEGSEGSPYDEAEVLRVSTTPDGYPDLEQALRALRRERGIERLLVEGGPRLNGALISRGLLNELFLTVAPKLLGGALASDIRTIIDGNLRAPEPLCLVSVHLAGGEIFLRYALRSCPD